MTRCSSLHQRAGRLCLIATVCLFSAGVLVVFVHDGRLTAQTTRDLPVIYKQCRHPSEGLKGVWINERHPSCGVDEEAMHIARETWDRTERFRRETEASRRPLSPEEEAAVTEHIERRFLGDGAEDRRAELQALLQTADSRISAILSGGSFDLTEEEAKQLRDARKLVESMRGEYAEAILSKRQLREARDRLAPTLTAIHTTLTGARRNRAAHSPNIENLVTRVDALVARVGTVIRELERSGRVVPPEVRAGHRRASQRVHEAKRTCSLARPESCSQLSEVLQTIDDMREPLCQLDSPLLTFCP